MINPRLLLPGMFLLALVSTSLAAADDKSTQNDTVKPTVTVEIKNIQFVPNEVTVSAGTTIKWINLDPVDHDVTSGLSINGRKSRGLKQTKFPDDKFSSGLFGKGKTFSITLDKKGEYQYYCNIHPFMTAKIIVK